MLISQWIYTLHVKEIGRTTAGAPIIIQITADNRSTAKNCYRETKLITCSPIRCGQFHILHPTIRITVLKNIAVNLVSCAQLFATLLYWKLENIGRTTICPQVSIIIQVTADNYSIA